MGDGGSIATTLDESYRCLDLRSHASLPEVTLSQVVPESSGSYLRNHFLFWCPIIEIHSRNIGQHNKQACSYQGGESLPRQVFVDHGFDPSPTIAE